ncbi:uncharacterized protein LAJ45_09108 [Morchella importuna]|uniref:uncharacterized protein n=1 Tax=Morchella importuna TaxID=1174673 RepID=UPI001E8DEEB2|nr:uncharacterized protein LAJ45_09108 [Morchella importuna]KAH8146734.1 hypothetical protein LAJ45_09108 [Morchella importuna]
MYVPRVHTFYKSVFGIKKPLRVFYLNLPYCTPLTSGLASNPHNYIIKHNPARPPYNARKIPDDLSDYTVKDMPTHLSPNHPSKVRATIIDTESKRGLNWYSTYARAQILTELVIWNMYSYIPGYLTLTPVRAHPVSGSPPIEILGDVEFGNIKYSFALSVDQK